MDKFCLSRQPKDVIPKDCTEIKNGVLYLLTVADENWKALETNPEGIPDFIVQTAKIQWAVDVAANFTTIYKVFCDTKKRR